MRSVSVVLGLAASLFLAGNLLAADQSQPPQHGHHGPPGMGPSPMERVDEMVKPLNLTDEQKAKIAELKKEYAPKFKEAHEKVDSILTPEQKKARQEAMQAARAAGKKWREAQKEVQATMNLTSDQKTKLAAARKEMMSVGKEFHENVLSVLTPEQKAQLPKHRRGPRNSDNAPGA
jgi:Spy/CpxP family protein refolding chaperone